MAYLWIKSLHEIAALWLAAGVFGSVVLRAWLKRNSGNPAGTALLARLHSVFSVPGVILSGAIGLYLVVDRWGFKAGWIHASMMLYLILLVSILFIQLPALKRGATGGMAAMLPHVDATLIVLMVILMATKPF